MSESKKGVLRLTITEAREQDEGDFTCEAVNTIGFIHSTGHVKIGSKFNIHILKRLYKSKKFLLIINLFLILILAPPRINRMPGDLSLPEHDNTKIKILYTGDQPMEVTLTKDGHKIVESPHIKYTIFDEYLMIFIRDISQEDAGKFNVYFD